MPSGPLTFDEQTHTYRVDGVAVPSVTQVIDAAGLVNKTWYTDESRTIGKYVSDVTALHDLGGLGEIILEADIQPYLDAWIRFREESGCEILGVEDAGFSESFSVAGRYDRLVYWHGKQWVIDIKTGVAEPCHHLQTAGYVLLIESDPLPYFGRGCVYLRADGRYNFVPHDDPADFDTFRACIALAHWKTRHRKHLNTGKPDGTADRY